ncbi:MAG: glycoside hydrolase family 28 protein [Granulosicoccus sp.]
MLSLVAVSAYTATVLIHADSEKYFLGSPLVWSLNDGEQTGTSECVPVFIENLVPDSGYCFVVAGEQLNFKTAHCAGLVDATDYGVSTVAKNNGLAFSEAIAAVPEGGTLFVPRGRYVSKPIFLKSDMTLLLCAGAEIAACDDRQDWPVLPAQDDTGRVLGTWEGLPDLCYASVVTAIDCERLTITGTGIIDGGGDRGDWWTWPKETRGGARRARTLFMAYCRDIILSGFTVRNSPSWTVHPFQCHNMTVAALSIKNPSDSPNTDGLDPESCTDVRLIGLHISVGDDCIAVKAGKFGTGEDRRIDHVAPTRRLTILNCLMLDGHGAVVMGSEMSGEITDVTILRCEFKGTDRGLRIKTRRGRGGRVARITMQDVSMDCVGTALAINAFYFCDADGKSALVQSRDSAPVSSTTPRIHDITVRDIVLKKVLHAAAAMLGLPEAPLRDIRLSGFSISYDPDATPGDALMACHIPPVCHGGILHRFAEITVDSALEPYMQEFPHVD